MWLTLYRYTYSKWDDAGPVYNRWVLYCIICCVGRDLCSTNVKQLGDTRKAAIQGWTVCSVVLPQLAAATWLQRNPTGQPPTVRVPSARSACFLALQGCGFYSKRLKPFQKPFPQRWISLLDNGTRFASRSTKEARGEISWGELMQGEGDLLWQSRWNVNETVNGSRRETSERALSLNQTSLFDRKVCLRRNGLRNVVKPSACMWQRQALNLKCRSCPEVLHCSRDVASNRGDPLAWFQKAC